MSKQHQSKLAGAAADEAGEFRRVWDPKSEHSVDLSWPKGKPVKQPPPEPFEQPFANFEKSIAKTVAKEKSPWPGTIPTLPETPPPALGLGEQLSLVFGKSPASGAQPAAPISNSAAQEAKAVVSAEVKAGANAARGETGLLARAGGVGGIVGIGLTVLNVYLAHNAYKEGVNAKLVWPQALQKALRSAPRVRVFSMRLDLPRCAGARHHVAGSRDTGINRSYPRQALERHKVRCEPNVDWDGRDVWSVSVKRGLMTFEPQKFFIGLMDLFSILLP